MTPHESCRSTEAMDRFEDAWRNSPGPRLDDYLPGPDTPERLDVLRDLLHIDIELRWKAGIGIPVEEYLRRYPELQEDRALVAELAACEYEMRHRIDTAVSPAEYEARFAGKAEGLSDLLYRTVPFSHVPPPCGPASVLPPGYEMVERIDEGGMGVVYKARQTALGGRMVAVKMIRADLSAHPQARPRFEAEARALGLLDHPGIVRVYDGGIHGDQPYIVMEYMEKGTLRDMVETGPMRPREAAERVAHLARAVHYAHTRHLVHRDLKPANVLVGADGTLKVTDFGLVRNMMSGGQTSISDRMGTPAYMAPEQAAGGGSVGPATDVWGLGGILYECLTGRPPHSGRASDEVIRAATKGEVTPPSKLKAGVPSGLERICMRALSVDPARRHPSAEALAEDLEHWLRTRVRRVQLAIAGGVLALVCAGLYLLWPTGTKPADKGEPPPTEPLVGELHLEVHDGQRFRVVSKRERGSVPVRNGQKVRFTAKVSEAAHIYMLYHAGSGKTYALYPWNPGKDPGVVKLRDAPAEDMAVGKAVSPGNVDGKPFGYPVGGKSSLDTVILIANRTALTAEDRAFIEVQLARLPRAESTDPLEVLEVDYSGGEYDERSSWSSVTRTIGKAVALDREFHEVIGPVAKRVDVLRAVRFSHVGDE